ncbi:class I adenylate-forming enzyme family protein [Nonomuraea dietziae]|uniref:class I adenylate-forming enzyme family protein n=1 Tax=Nonomuraea dietziae TaxID=65515 RepID=UPI0033E3E560
MAEINLSPTSGLTVPDCLRHVAAGTPAAPFVREPDGAELGYAAALEEATAIASGLIALGVGRGDRVHLHLPNSAAFLTHLLAVAEIGAVAVPTSPESSSDELAYVLSHSGCVVSVSSLLGRPAVEEARDLCPDLRDIRGPGELATLGQRRTAAGWPPPDSLDPVAILYTSGTTGWPKGVVITHANLLIAGEVVAGHLRLRPDDRWLVTLPLSHGNALFYSAMSALVTGASMVVCDGLDPAGWVGLAGGHGVTVTSFFASGIRRLLASPAHPADRDHTIRAALFGQPLTPAQLSAFETRFGLPLLQIYGMTETVSPVLMNPLYGQRRNDTLGLPVLGYPLRVAGPPDAPGELLVGGTPGVTLMAGYYNAPQLTSRVIDDGWLHTGDQVRLEPDGYVSFVDRQADILKPDTENVSAGEVERVLAEHPSVLEAAVTGAADDDGGQHVVAYVAVRPGEDVTAEELLDHCRVRLSPYKVPKDLHMVADLPRTPTGKVRRHALGGER